MKTNKLLPALPNKKCTVQYHPCFGGRIYWRLVKLLMIGKFKMNIQRARWFVEEYFLGIHKMSLDRFIKRFS